jgi:hypothetical protein
MNVFLVAVVFGLGAGQAAQPAPGGKVMGGGMDGKWQIVYAEEGGRRNNSWEQQQATVEKGTLSYEGEGGKKRSLKFKTGPGQTVEATGDEGGKSWKGVYILGQDYLCLSLSKALKLKATPEPAPAALAPPGGGGEVGGGTGGGSSGDFILILRRVRAKAAPK